VASLIKHGLEESPWLVLIKFTKDVFQNYIISDNCNDTVLTVLYMSGTLMILILAILQKNFGALM